MAPNIRDHPLSPALGDLVRSVWSLDYDADAAELPGLIAPDAQVEFVFQTGAPAGLVVAGEELPCSPRAMIYALRHGTLRMVPRGANRILAFRTAPAVASVILGNDLGDCWDRPVPLAELIGAEAELLLDRIASTPRDALGTVVENWLTTRLGGWTGEDADNLALQHRLFWRFTLEPVSHLADELGVTARTLRRRCARYTGLSPKQFVMSGRMLRGCGLLHHRPDLRIVDIAYRLGFSDQSAFTNAFGHYVGMSPGQLRAEPLVFCEAP